MIGSVARSDPKVRLKSDATEVPDATDR